VIGQFFVGGRAVRVDFSRGRSLAIALDFAGPQPCLFGAAPAAATPMVAGPFVGSTRQGGPCNVLTLTLNPHCNGTHTESVAHIVNQAVPVYEAVPPGPVPASLVTVTPARATVSGENYRPALGEGDTFITAASLCAILDDRPDGWLEAVVIRTRPNDDRKLTRRYGEGGSSPFFSIEAIDYLHARGVKHLLVDVPSVDRMHDDGLLTVHHRFWNVPEGTHNLIATSHQDRTLTEMIFVPDALPDGPYLLALHVPAFQADAAPSWPWVYPVEFV
jgi:kynurenine formamidase